MAEVCPNNEQMPILLDRCRNVENNGHLTTKSIEKIEPNHLKIPLLTVPPSGVGGSSHHSMTLETVAPGSDLWTAVSTDTR